MDEIKMLLPTFRLTRLWEGAVLFGRIKKAFPIDQDDGSRHPDDGRISVQGRHRQAPQSESRIDQAWLSNLRDEPECWCVSSAYQEDAAGARARGVHGRSWHRGGPSPW